MASAGNMATSAKFLGSAMKVDTSDPGYPEVDNELFNLFPTALNTLFKPLTISSPRVMILYIQFALV